MPRLAPDVSAETRPRVKFPMIPSSWCKELGPEQAVEPKEEMTATAAPAAPAAAPPSSPTIGPQPAKSVLEMVEAMQGLAKSAKEPKVTTKAVVTGSPRLALEQPSPSTMIVCKQGPRKRPASAMGTSMSGALPKGWTVSHKKRATGTQAGSQYHIYFGPQGQRCRSLKEVLKCEQRTCF